MFQFLNEDVNTSNALIAAYDPILVILSFLVAFLASYSVLAIAERIRDSRNHKRELAWIAAGSFIFGTGVWAMHFIGMVAFRLPVTVDYSLKVTALSVVPAIISGFIALPLIGEHNLTYRRLLPGGFILGAGIGIMHYTGMEAMEINATMFYRLDLFLLSVVVAVVLATLGLYLNQYILSLKTVGNLTAMSLSAAVLGLAVTGMHYTAMTATVFLPSDTLSRGDQAFNHLLFGVTIFLVTLALIALATFMTVIESRFQKMADNITMLSNRLYEAIESITDGFLIFDNAGNLLISNSRFHAMYPEMSDVLKPGTPYETFLRRWASLQNTLPNDVSAEEFVRDQVDTLFDQGHSHEEWECKDRWLYIKESKTNTGDIVSIWSDVTQMKELQLELERRAFHDALTGLPNRDLFHDRIEKAIAKSKRFEYMIAVLYLDLDGFKPVNDKYGHKAGDLVLKVIASRIQGCIRETDTVARLGGDEFAVLLEPYIDRDNVNIVANRILHTLQDPIEIEMGETRMGVSIGVCLDGGDGNTVETFIRNADEAMYDVKETGKNAIKFYEAEVA